MLTKSNTTTTKAYCYAQNTLICCAPGSTLRDAYWPLMMTKERKDKSDLTLYIPRYGLTISMHKRTYIVVMYMVYEKIELRRKKRRKRKEGKEDYI